MTLAAEFGDDRATPDPTEEKILLDSPAKQPAAGVLPVAKAFAQIIEKSQPQFAIGIFGDWGSGKTTLMETIERELSEQVSVVVRFSAWRFEREQLLLIPLLDSIRASLFDWGQAKQTVAGERVKRARAVAARIGRVVRALASGVSGEIGISGAVKVTLDPSKTIDMLASANDDEAERPQSLFFAGFRELAGAFDEFAKDGAARIVVFVDDLDRCLPANALEVLEAMKLFFDLPGFVFVVGLDEDVVERAVRTKLRQDAARSAEDDLVTPVRLGREYVRKIFQVQYALPPVVTEQLDSLLEAMYVEAGVEGGQLDDLRERVAAFLDHVSVDGQINPREVKRFINAYTLQMLVRPKLERDAVLALQTIIFRDDWDAVYSALLADAFAVTDALDRYRGGYESARDEIWPQNRPIPSGLLRFLRSPQAKPLISVGLDPYLFSLERTRSVDPSLIPLLRNVGQLRRLVRRSGDIRWVDDDVAAGIRNEVEEIVDRLRSATGPADTIGRFNVVLDTLRRTTAELAPSAGRVEESRPPQKTPDRVEVSQGLRTRLENAVEDVARELAILRSSMPRST